MQCRYCGAENPNAARICASCKQPIPIVDERDPDRGVNYVRIKRDGCFNPPAPQFGINTHVQTLRRTRRLTGSTLPKSKPSPSVAADMRYAYGSPRTERQSAPHASQDPSTYRPSTQDRTEPRWNEPTTPLPDDPAFRSSYFSPAAEQDVTLGKKPKTLRILFMLCIFVVGAGAGLAGAWWFSQGGSLPFVAAEEDASPPPLTPVKRLSETPPAGTTGATRGISSSELPYDGAMRPSENVDVPKQQERVAAGETKVLAPPIRKAVKPKTPDASASQEVSASDKHETGVAALAGESSGAQRPGPEVAQEQARENRRAVAEKTDSTKPVAKVSAGSGASESAKRAEVPKRASQPKAEKGTKDREIDRIRQQAEEELKKKSEHGRQIGRLRAKGLSIAKAEPRRGESQNTSTARTANVWRVRDSLAQCERAPNIFRREQCKWRVCGGAWGKNGCPSYERHASNAY